MAHQNFALFDTCGLRGEQHGVSEDHMSYILDGTLKSGFNVSLSTTTTIFDIETDAKPHTE